MHKILVIRLHFPLDALHVLDYISPSSGTTFKSCTALMVYAGICRYHTSGCCVAIATQWIFRKWDGVVGTGWSWLRIGTGGGRL